MKSKKAIKKLKKAIKKLKNKVDGFEDYAIELEILTKAVQLQNGKLQSEIKTIAKHVQNLEAEKCSCKTYYTPMSAIDLIKNPEFNTCHTNTQKTDKNATEGKQGGKNRIWEPLPNHIPVVKFSATTDETIVTNEMFNEELESKLKKNILEYHPAFMLLNGVIPSNTIEDLIRAELKSKGEHYSPNGDRYSNFKRLNNSAAKQKTVKERIENFMEKHEIWIEDYQAGDVNGTLLDLIESCIDVLNYHLLLDIYLNFNGEA